MTLLLSQRASEDRQRLNQAAVSQNMPVVHLDWRVSVSESLSRPLHFYGEPLFGDVVSAQLPLTLLEAPLDWLASCPYHLLQRDIQVMTFEQALHNDFPCHVKLLDDKRLPPIVYDSADELVKAPVENDEMVLVSEVRDWQQEWRLFVLNGEVITGSVYQPSFNELTDSQSHQAQTFIDKVFEEVGHTFPAATVIDVALEEDNTLSIVELNAAWASGLYRCQADKALHVITHCTYHIDDVPQNQKQFQRSTVHVQF